MGGEEIAVFFSGLRSKEIVPIVEQSRLSIEKMKTKSGSKTIPVTISVGVSHREVLSQSLSEVMKTADKALYKAKEGGRNQVQVGGLKASRRKSDDV